MRTYLIRRFAQSALTLVVLVAGVFFLNRMTGSPANLYLPLNATKEMRDEFTRREGLDRPVLEQFWSFMSDVVRGDFGESLRQSRPALDIVLERYPATLQIATLAMVLALIVAMLLGSLAARHPGSLMDRGCTFFSLAAAGTPDFWLALMGILLFSVTLGWLPTSGTVGAASWVLPVLTLMARPTGVLIQIVRGAMLTVLTSQYIRAARAKGLGELRVLFGHGLRNACIPILVVAGDLSIGLLNGAVIVETIFGWPGVGSLLIDSIVQRDFVVTQAIVIVSATAIFLLFIFLDIVYARIDPRIRYQ